MREAYHEELASISEGLVEMANTVGSAMGTATTALLDADLQLAERVISGVEQVDDLQRDLEDR
ncbi:PhoU domain-containing protein, partial [Streptomyces monashensis]|uniref:PhoU domain-containing protein n=1 Tax=Streptomyces monashensis TaxID=1678012 RepID=UPI00340749A7